MYEKVRNQRKYCCVVLFTNEQNLFSKSSKTNRLVGSPIMFHRNSFNRKSIQIKDFIMSRFVCIAYFPKIIYCSTKCWSVLLKVTAEGLGNILFNFEDETNIVILSLSPCWPLSLPACCPLITCGKVFFVHFYAEQAPRVEWVPFNGGKLKVC